MIVNVHKYLLYGAKEEMDRFFDLAQRAGFLEFIGIWHKKALELPQSIKYILSAIKILRIHTGAEQGIDLSVPSDPATLAEKAVHLNTALERLYEERRILNAEILRIAPFGDFSKDDLSFIEQNGKRILQFFCMKSDHSSDLVLPPEVVFIGTDYDLDYYAAVNRDRMHYPKMIEIQIDKPVGELRTELHEVKNRIAVFEAEMRSWAAHLPFLQEGLIDALNHHHLQSAKHDASYPLGEAAFAIEAWVPETRIKGLNGLLSGLSVGCEEISIEPMDRVPTCMENKGLAKIGEDLVLLYDTPATTDKDPSLWIVCFFAVFFAMIISDAGYGLLYLAIGLFLKWKFPRITGAGKRFIKLTLILASTTILWGIFTASFFGLEIGPDNPYRKISALHYLATKKADYLMETKNDLYQEYLRNYPAVATAKDGHDFLVKASKTAEGKTQYAALENFYDSSLMEIALIMGIFHLSCAFARYLLRTWAGLGWIAFMIGGYLYFPTSLLDATSIVVFMGWISKPFANALGMQLVYGGFGFAILATLIQKGLMAALLEVLNVIQVFGDVLSYLRLYALGLAGMIVGTTFNALGANFGLLIGAFVVLFGHLVNINLSVMSGVIHGLRLNFLEWYHYCWAGEGKLFNPLRLKRTKP